MLNGNKYYAIKQEYEIHFDGVPKESGIYLGTRVENGNTYFYVGQAKNLFNRRFDYYQIQVGLSYPKRHFEASLKKHKDWSFRVLEHGNMSTDDLNVLEKMYIDKFNALPNHITRNDLIANQDIVKSNAKRVNSVVKKYEKQLIKLFSRVDINFEANVIQITPIAKKDKKSFTKLSLGALSELTHGMKGLIENGTNKN